MFRVFQTAISVLFSVAIAACNSSSAPETPTVVVKNNSPSSPLTCNVSPSSFNVTIPVDSDSTPAPLGPVDLSFTISSNLEARVISVAGPEGAYLSLSSGTPVPTSSATLSNSITASLRETKSGTVTFNLMDDESQTATCTTQVHVSTVSMAAGNPTSKLYARGDFNGDSTDDVASFEATTGSFWIAQGQGSGNYLYKNFGTLAGSGPFLFYAADLNQDGKQDLLIYDISNGHWKAAFSTGSQFQFADLGSFPSAIALSEVSIADLNSDGVADVFYSSGGVHYKALVHVASHAAVGSIDSTPVAVYRFHIHWTANREKAVNATGGGYKVYYGVSAGFDTASASYVDVPYVSGGSAPVTGVSPWLPAGTYYTKVIAYSSLNNLSGTAAKSTVSSEISVSLP